jgi:hypothetical protein
MSSNMAIGNDTSLTWSRVAANRQVQVANELFPGGLENSNGCTSDEIKDAVKNFRSHPAANQRFSSSANSTKKLVQLTLWVEDRIRLGQDAEFEDGTTQAEFVSMIDESQQREKIRQERKKNAEGLATMKIDPPLKSSSGWDGWKDSVNTALMLARGSEGVPSLRVIRQLKPPLSQWSQQEASRCLGRNWRQAQLVSQGLIKMPIERQCTCFH